MKPDRVQQQMLVNFEKKIASLPDEQLDKMIAKTIPEGEDYSVSRAIRRACVEEKRRRMK